MHTNTDTIVLAFQNLKAFSATATGLEHAQSCRVLWSAGES